MKTNFWRKRIADYNFKDSIKWLLAATGVVYGFGAVLVAAMAGLAKVKDAIKEKLAVADEEIEEEEF